MTQVFNYNFYNILKLQIVRQRHRSNFRDLINLKFSYFRTSQDIGRPDIILNIGNFIPSYKNCFLINRKYYVEKDYFYCQHSEGKAKWEIEVIGIDQKTTKINFNVVNKFGVQSLINPDFLPQISLLEIISYKLSKEGYVLLHSAAISKNDQAYLLCGRGGSFKTTLCMDFVRKAGFKCLSDDYVVLSKHGVLSFPLHPSLFKFMTKHLSNENSWRFFDKFHYIWHLFRKDYVNNQQVDKPVALKALLFITRTNRKIKQVIIEYSKETLKHIISRLLINNVLENFENLKALKIDSGPFYQYFLVYSFVFPKCIMAIYNKNVERNLERILKDIKVYNVEIPFNYSLESFREIYSFINEAD